MHDYSDYKPRNRSCPAARIWSPVALRLAVYLAAIGIGCFLLAH